ncbi:MAG: hypothetical protein KGJ13_01650 [Patescibacteria group bacterium]|nr:hypothetical protein [Patescibacteria group bacterium]
MLIEKMAETDLVVGREVGNTITVLHPAVTAGMRTFGDLERLPGELDRKWWELMMSIYRPRHFVHFGNLDYFGRSGGVATDFDACGGFVRLEEDQGEKMVFFCDKCVSKMAFRMKCPDLADAILHLLLKQMMPGLRIANYLWAEETGTVGVLPNVVRLKSKIQLDTDYATRADLGFMLMPGMNTLEGFCGYDEWVRQLLRVKFDQLAASQDLLRRSVLGPEHFGGRAGYMRFWSYS